MNKIRLLTLLVCAVCITHTFASDEHVRWSDQGMDYELAFRLVPPGECFIPVDAVPQLTNPNASPREWKFTMPAAQTVKIDAPFYLAMRELNQGELESLIRASASDSLTTTQADVFKATGFTFFDEDFTERNLPAMCLTFSEARDVCVVLQEFKRGSLNGNTLVSVDIRLPTPDEWIYARVYGNATPRHFPRWPVNAETIARNVLNDPMNAQILDAMRHALGMITQSPDTFSHDMMDAEKLKAIAAPLIASEEAMLFMLNELDTGPSPMSNPDNNAISPNEAAARLRFVIAQHLLEETGVTLLVERADGVFTQHYEGGQLWDDNGPKPCFSTSAGGHALGLVGLDGNVAEWLVDESNPRLAFPSLFTMTLSNLTVAGPDWSETEITNLKKEADDRDEVCKYYAGVRPALSVVLRDNWRMQLRMAHLHTHAPAQWDAWIEEAASATGEIGVQQELRVYGDVYTQLLRLRSGTENDLAGALKRYAAHCSSTTATGARGDVPRYLDLLASRYRAP